MSPETVNFFLSLDMKLLEMISQTEMTAFVQLTNTPEPGYVGSSHFFHLKNFF